MPIQDGRSGQWLVAFAAYCYIFLFEADEAALCSKPPERLGKGETPAAWMNRESLALRG